MRNIIWMAVLAMSFAFVSVVVAADVASVDPAAIYKAKCSACHGAKGEGKKGMAPAHHGNEFIIKGTAEEIKKVILEGRTGAAKKYDKKLYPIDMAKVALTDAEADAIIKFMKEDIQK